MLHSQVERVFNLYTKKQADVASPMRFRWLQLQISRRTAKDEKCIYSRFSFIMLVRILVK